VLPIKPFRGIFKRLYYKYKLLNKNKVVISKVDGITYELNLNELIDSSIYYMGCFEPLTTKVINKFVKSGMVVFDIGANIGCHTLRFAKLVGENGKVFAFEPMSDAFLKLKRNIKLNNFDNIINEQIALSNITQEKQQAFFRTSWLLDGTIPSREKKENVNFITLDEYVKRSNMNRIDFIKLDVDGYEYKIIQGGKTTLKQFKPLLLIELGEYTLNNFGDKVENLINLLDSLGYAFYSEENLKEYNNKKSLIDSIPSGGTINVLCKPKL
jgi:FkbM family methyltransferase